MRFLILFFAVFVFAQNVSAADKPAAPQDRSWFIDKRNLPESTTSPAANPRDGEAARLGRLVGAATACPKLDRRRISTATESVDTLLKSIAQAPGELEPIKKTFDASVVEGQQAIASRRLECTAAERDLADFERAYNASRIATVTNTSKPKTTPEVTETAGPQWVSGPQVQGVTADEVVFGISAPFSGPTKELGQGMKVGIDAAFSQANAKGGVNGRKLRLVAADDGYEPTRTAETMKQLYDKERVFGIIGNVGTPTAVVALPYALERRVLFYGAFTGANVLRRDPPDRYVFNFRASYAEETEAVVRYLIKIRRLKPEQIAVFAQQDSFGDAGFEGVAKAIRAFRGGEDLEILRLGYKRNTLDIDDALKRLAASRVPIKAVVMVATYRAAATFISRTRDANPTMIYTNVSFVGSTALADELKLLGPRFSKGVIVTQVVPAVDSYSNVALEFKSALATYAPSETPNYVSFEGYLAAKVLIEALRKAGAQLDTEKLIDTLETLRDFDVGLGATINFSSTEHQALHKVWGTQLDGEGRYQALELQ